MLGSYADMSFLDFFWYQGKPSHFLCGGTGRGALRYDPAFLFRKEKGSIPQGRAPHGSHGSCAHGPVGGHGSPADPGVLPAAKPAITNGLICCALMVIGILYNFARKRDFSAVSEPLKAIDFETVGLLFGLFLMIEGSPPRV